MDGADEMIELLTEIRDLQRTHLEEYRRVTAEFKVLQEQAVRVQTASVRRQKMALAVLMVLLGLLVIVLSLPHKP